MKRVFVVVLVAAGCGNQMRTAARVGTMERETVPLGHNSSVSLQWVASPK
jgi:hypothetical protein